MKIILGAMERFSQWVVGVAMGVVVLAMGMQVFYRYVLIRPLAWTDTMAKFAFVYCVFFGAFVGVRKKMHVVLDKIPASLPPFMQLAIALLVNLMVIGILALCAYYGFALFQTALTSLLPAVNIPLGYIYLPFAITSAMTILSYVDLSLDAVKAYREDAHD